MNAKKLLKELYSLRISLAVEAGHLCVDAPGGILSKTLTDGICAHKVELINLLTIGGTPKAVLATNHPEQKRRALPSPLQMDYAYKWLKSFNMEERIRGRCNPARKCRFLTGWLPNDLQKEFEEKADLRWRDWNFLFNKLHPEREGEREEKRELLHLLSKTGMDILLLDNVKPSTGKDKRATSA